ncbi:hypothetical protein BconGalA64_43340 [Burkholderia contaminans]|nr:hypothetical protein BconGalA64_43340 [Burkholderia contaminans]
MAEAVAARAGSAKPRHAFNHDSNICCIGWAAGSKPVLPAEVPACADVDEFFDAVITCLTGDS